MKIHIAALLIPLALLVGCVGCSGSTARDEVLAPVVMDAAQDVFDLAYVGVEGWDHEPGSGGATEAYNRIETFRAKLETRTYTEAEMAADAGYLREWARRGVEVRIAAGEIGPGVAKSLNERTDRLYDALLVLVGAQPVPLKEIQNDED